LYQSRLDVYVFLLFISLCFLTPKSELLRQIKNWMDTLQQNVRHERSKKQREVSMVPRGSL